MLRFAFLALALALTGGALTGGALAASPGEDGSKRVCRAPAANLGSRIKRAKICRTAAEWEEMERARRGPELRTKPSQLEPWERSRPQ
jgi:hypothetical protein